MITLTDSNVLSRSERADRVREALRQHSRVMMSSGLQSPFAQRENVWVNELYEGGRVGCIEYCKVKVHSMSLYRNQHHSAFSHKTNMLLHSFQCRVSFQSELFQYLSSIIYCVKLQIATVTHFSSFYRKVNALQSF